MSVNNGGPAFPRAASVDQRQGTMPEGDLFVEEQDGISVRDYFAAQIIPSVYEEYWRTVRAGESFPEADWKRGIAGDAYAIADAMLQAREKGGG